MGRRPTATSVVVLCGLIFIGRLSKRGSPRVPPTADRQVPPVFPLFGTITHAAFPNTIDHGIVLYGSQHWLHDRGRL
jgi:hypothetical protein